MIWTSHRQALEEKHINAEKLTNEVIIIQRIMIAIIIIIIIPLTQREVVIEN
jgi:hypothetical protein